MKNSKANAHILRVVVIIAILGLLVIFFVFRSRMNNTLNETTETYLTENVDALAAVFYTKLDDQMVMLESQTRYFKDVDLTDYNKMKSTIISTKGIGAFNSIGVSSSSGATMDYNGKSAGNILLTDYFKEAMAGENSISEPEDGDKDEVLVLAVPIKQKSDVVGIVYGTFDSEVLDSLVGTVRFAENAANVLITEEGNIIAKTTDTPWISDEATNLAEEIPGLNIRQGRDNLLYRYTKNGQKNIVVLTSVGVHDWYFATVIPESEVTAQNRRVERLVIYVIAGVAIIFLVLMLIVYILNRRNARIERENERLMTVSEQTKDIIIDFDYKSRRLTLEGDVSELIDEKKDYYDDKDVAEILSRIHSEDVELFEALNNIAEIDKKMFTGEGRYRCTDDEYRWYQVNLTIVADSDDKVTRLIGSLSNVDERVNKEMNLVHKAETDQLTGVTNKMAFEETVQGVLDGAKDGEALALFIIDLDNFKKVNDTLGHVVGDRVLTEVARKLQIVFPNQHTLGRIGGDEFSAYIYFDRDDGEIIERIKTRADQICKSLRMTYSSLSTDETVTVSSSVGIAIYPRDGQDFRELYLLADKALYRSKHDGKNRYTLWKSSEAWEDDDE